MNGETPLAVVHMHRVMYNFPLKIKKRNINFPLQYHAGADWIDLGFVKDTIRTCALTWTRIRFSIFA